MLHGDREKPRSTEALDMGVKESSWMSRSLEPSEDFVSNYVRVLKQELPG